MNIAHKTVLKRVGYWIALRTALSIGAITLAAVVLISITMLVYGFAEWAGARIFAVGR